MVKPNARHPNRAISGFGKFLWLVVLVPVLGISAWSLWVVARYLGAPRVFAVCFSTCFDGVALLAADYSLRYAQAGLSGSFPRAVVRIWAAVAAYVQTLHAQITHGLPGSWLMWASLPVSAVTVYEIHIRWERRRALAAAGTTYPAQLPAFGVVTWALFPIRTLTAFEGIVQRRLLAIARTAADRPALMVVEPPKAEPPKAVAPAKPHRPASVTAISAHSPTKHIRIWAKEQGHPVGDRARLPQWVIDEYNRAHGQAAEG